jgi:hypothetical protein
VAHQRHGGAERAVRLTRHTVTTELRPHRRGALFAGLASALAKPAPLSSARMSPSANKRLMRRSKQPLCSTTEPATWPVPMHLRPR